MKPRRIALALAALLTTLIFAALAYLAPGMRPIPQGNLNDFWYNALAVDLTNGSHSSRGTAIRYSSDWWIYSIVGMHGSSHYSIANAEVQTDWPRAQTELVKAAAEPPAPDRFVGSAFRRWRSFESSHSQTIENLILCINEGVIDRNTQLGSTPMSLWWTRGSFDMHQVARTAEFYWFNFLFEFLWLSGLVWLALWPLIRGWRMRWFYSCLAIAFVLLYVPHWFGYCVLSRVPWGPTGGILYPWIIFYNAWPWAYCWWDHHFLINVPPIFSAINQGMPITFRDLDDFHSNFASHGPTDVLLKCLALLAGVGAVHWIMLHIEWKTSQKGGRQQLADGSAGVK